MSNTIIKHLRTNTVDESGNGKLFTSSLFPAFYPSDKRGVITINYADNVESLSILNNSNKVVPFNLNVELQLPDSIGTSVKTSVTASLIEGLTTAKNIIINNKITVVNHYLDGTTHTLYGYDLHNLIATDANKNIVRVYAFTFDAGSTTYEITSSYKEVTLTDAGTLSDAISKVPTHVHSSNLDVPVKNLNAAQNINATGSITAGNSATASDITAYGQIKSKTTSKPPLDVASKELVWNLNAELWNNMPLYNANADNAGNPLCLIKGENDKLSVNVSPYIRFSNYGGIFGKNAKGTDSAIKMISFNDHGLALDADSYKSMEFGAQNKTSYTHIVSNAADGTQKGEYYFYSNAFQFNDVTGSTTPFKVTKDGSITASSKITVPTVNATNVSASDKVTATNSITGKTLVSTVANGTAPLTVASSTKVTNLNADLLDGKDATSFIQTQATSQSITGNLNITGTLSSDGAISGDSISVVNDATIDGNTTVGGSVTATNSITGKTLVSNVANGTAPLTVTSSTNVANLNADLLDGKHLSDLSYTDPNKQQSPATTLIGVPVTSVTQSNGVITVEHKNIPSIYVIHTNSVDDSEVRLKDKLDTVDSEIAALYEETHSHENKSVLDGITSAKVTNWDAAASQKHTHSNKTVLDGITSTKVTNWDTAASQTHTHSNKTVLDGITSTKVTSWDTAASQSHVHSLSLSVPVQALTVNSNIIFNEGSWGKIGYTDSAGFHPMLNYSPTTGAVTLQSMTIGDKKSTLEIGGLNTKSINFGYYFTKTYTDASGQPQTKDGARWFGWSADNAYIPSALTVAPKTLDNTGNDINDTTVAPIKVFSKVVCQNLNADLLDGKHATSFIQTSATNQTITGNLKITGNLEVGGTIVSASDIIAYGTSASATALSDGATDANVRLDAAKAALADVENASSIDEIKTILINLRNAL